MNSRRFGIQIHSDFCAKSIMKPKQIHAAAEKKEATTLRGKKSGAPLQTVIPQSPTPGRDAIKFRDNLIELLNGGAVISAETAGGVKVHPNGVVTGLEISRPQPRDPLSEDDVRRMPDYLLVLTIARYAWDAFPHVGVSVVGPAYSETITCLVAEAKRRGIKI